MSRSALHFLGDIIRAIDLVQRYAAGHDATALKLADSSRDAALFQLVVVGEAVRHLPVQIRALAPDTPWPQISGMRDYIVHGYWQIDFKIVADTIAFDLVPLLTAATRLAELIEITDR